MITRTEPACQAKQRSNDTDTIQLHNDHGRNTTWQAALASIIRDPLDLFRLLELDISQLPKTLAASQSFPLQVPHSFVQRMKKGDWNDPLLLQVLPQEQELQVFNGYTLDPLAEKTCNPHSGLIHKYHGRVLLIASGGCAINCRYCFRRHFPYNQNIPNQGQWQEILHYITQDSSIKEVIFSGGDPLAASDKQLSDKVQSLAKITHIRTLRIHSRLPIVIPERITQQCIDWLTGCHLQPVMVIHCNHANELDHNVAAALQKLKSAGVTLLNQTVLLAGINDNEDSLIELNERLFELGVLPYYLHLLDKVQGAAHFDVTQVKAKKLISGLLSKLPGYLVPKLVREQPHALSKVPIHPY